MSIEKAYDAWAARYDTDKNKTRDLDSTSTAATLSSYSFQHVLELGCGTGKNTELLLNRAERVIGLDFSQAMLDIAKEKVANNRAQFIKVDLTSEWNVDAQWADLVTSSLTLEHIENLDPVFEQSNRTLAKNGLFFISELHPYRQYDGSGARFESENETVHIEIFIHHLTDYINSAKANGFELLETREWFDGPIREGIPRLISFLFRKKIS